MALTGVERRAITDPVERFWASVERVGDCWVWQATLDGGGYGDFTVNARRYKVHRWSYEQFVGPIPDGLQIDHLCRVRNCVNPAHMEPVTCKENIRRGMSTAGMRFRQTHCKNGHVLAGANMRIDPRGFRRCLPCYRQWRWDRAQRLGWRPLHVAAVTHDG